MLRLLLLSSLKHDDALGRVPALLLADGLVKENHRRVESSSKRWQLQAAKLREALSCLPPSAQQLETAAADTTLVRRAVVLPTSIPCHCPAQHHRRLPAQALLLSVPVFGVNHPAPAFCMNMECEGGAQAALPGTAKRLLASKQP